MINAKNEGRLVGRHILITGAASGIGFATAMLFAEHGAKVGIIDQDAAAAERAAATFGGVSAAADVSNEKEVRQAVKKIAEELGALDGLVNCAGIFIPGRAEEGDTAGWVKSLAVNLTGPFLVTVAALPFLMAAEKAAIVNVSSAIGVRPSPRQGAYAASKGGLIAWSKVLAQELGPKIRVNVICPGPTATPMSAANSGRDPDAVRVGRALDRGAQPHEQAEAMLFLMSDASSYVTGVTLPVDGGRVYL